MTRSKMNEARRRRRLRERHGRGQPAAREEPSGRSAAAGREAAPAAWGERRLLVLGACALVVQVAGAVIVWRLNSAYSLAGMFTGNPLFTLVAFPVAEPVARRLTNAPRPLRLLETLSAGAVTLMLFVAVSFAAFIVVGAVRHRDYGDPNHPAWVGMIVLVLAFACAAGPPASARIQWRFLALRGRSSPPS